MRIGYCATHKEDVGVFMARWPSSKCKAIQHLYIMSHSISYIYYPNRLNEYICGPMNRNGFLCSECIDGFSPSFTSPDHVMF